MCGGFGNCAGCMEVRCVVGVALVGWAQGGGSTVGYCRGARVVVVRVVMLVRMRVRVGVRLMGMWMVRLTFMS